MEFADYIKSLRAEKNLTRSEMARRAGFTPQYAMSIERGILIPSEEYIEKLVEVLDGDEVTAFKLADKMPVRCYEEAKKRYYEGSD